MKKWWLEITLHSDLCAATGDSERGAANIKTALEQGIPWIPARRLKGSLLNEGREMASNGFVGRQVLERLFGAPGLRHPAALHIGDAHLYRIPGGLLNCPQDKGDVVLEDYEKELKSLKKPPSLSEEVTELLLTRSRTRTALEKETGTAQDGMLRTIQIVPRGMVFRSMITLQDTENGESAEVLKRCVKALRHMGLGITRGYGEISCELHEIAPDDSRDILQKKQGFDGPEQGELWYEIELLNPALFAGDKGLYEDCCDYIPGAAIMGAMAAMYIADHKLGRNAHEDENFRRIFLRDGVQFGNGFLRRGEKIFYPCPSFLAVEKTGVGKFINRLAKDGESVRRKEISSQICPDWEQRNIYLADVEKEVRMHHARPVDRGIGHAVNDRIQAGAVDMGQFFQYTCLSKGQKFSGVIRGEWKDIQALLQCLDKRNCRLQLGRSRTAEYGEARFIPCLCPAEERNYLSKKWLLWLLSPLVFKDCGNYMADSELKSWERQMTERFGCKVRLRNEEREHILKYTKVGGYHSVWNLPLPQYMSLAPGSAVCMEADEKLSAADLEKEFWGDMTGRGYGQIHALPWELVEDSMGDYARIMFEEEAQKAEEPQESDFIQALKHCRKEQENLEEKRLNALQVLGELPNMTTIEQITRVVEMGAANTYKTIMNQLEKIKNEEKRELAIAFIKPCEGKEEEFIKAYLESSKWRARREADVNDRKGK